MNDNAVDIRFGSTNGVILGRNLTYIVACTAFREQNGILELLMVQESKKSCYAKWYIPSGRVERGEKITEAAKREFFEESGYNCEPEELICLQVADSTWYRFAFYCNITSGDRKTVEDKESICSNWFPVRDVMSRKLNLRASDFLKIIDEGLRYREWRTKQNIILSNFLPVAHSVSGLFVQFLIYRTDGVTNEIFVRRMVTDASLLCNEHNVFPLVEYGFQIPFATVISNSLKQILEDGEQSPISVARVECLPSPADCCQHGILVRVICEANNLHSAAANFGHSPYQWIKVPDEILEKLQIGPCQFRPSITFF